MLLCGSLWFTFPNFLMLGMCSGAVCWPNAEDVTLQGIFHGADQPVRWHVSVEGERVSEGIADVLWSLERIDPYFTSGGKWVGGEGVGGQFMVWCAVIVFASTYSFLGRQERRATGTSTCWVCLNSLLSASRLMASGGESGAAGVWVLKKR